MFRLEERAYVFTYLKANKMIPKIIHYCWFGANPKSLFIKNCIASWKTYLPDFEIRQWSEKDFDLDSIPFVKQAYEAKKWAFVADYIRLVALDSVGGIYMDTDVRVLKPFPDTWFEYDFFSAHEYHPGLYDDLGKKKLNENYVPYNLDDNIDGFAILSAVMASKPGHQFIRDCIAFYNNVNFLNESNTFDITKVIIGEIITKRALKYGYIYKDQRLELQENMLILESDVLVGNSLLLNDNSYAIHLANGSWVEKNGLDKFLYKVRNDYPKFYPLSNIVVKLIRKISPNN